MAERVYRGSFPGLVRIYIVETDAQAPAEPGALKLSIEPLDAGVGRRVVAQVPAVELYRLLCGDGPVQCRVDVYEAGGADHA